VAEALQLTAADVDLAGEALILGEQDGRGRGVPVPASVVQALDIIHGIRRAQKSKDGGRSARLWPVDRTTAWRWVRRVMNDARLKGPQASPRGLRHGFGVQAVIDGTPLQTIQTWMGHKELESTAVYADVVRDRTE
jgi:integrase/recombinase XerD